MRYDALPLVSIVVPSFNQGTYIDDTLRSILNQDYPNIEVLVMDGGSTDETLSVLERYKDRISYISELDRGQSHAVNKGFELAKGDIIGWLNSDDLYPNRLALRRMVEAFSQMPEADILYGDFVEIDAHNRVIKYWRRPDFSFSRLLRVGYISQPSTFMRHRAIKKLPVREDLHYAMDTELWLRAAHEGLVIRHVPFLVAAERLHDLAKNLKDTNKVADEAVSVRTNYGARINSWWRMRRAFDKFVLYIFRLPSIFTIRAYRLDPSRLTVRLDFSGAILRTLAIGVRSAGKDHGAKQ